ncbi:MAG TPA: acyl-CoA dehydrogenase family protein [Solirubrobacterales bacterium]
MYATERPTSDDAHEVLARVRDFARRELVPQQEHFDSFPDVPVSLHDAFRDLGFCNWWLPERCGGMGLGLEESVDLVSELAYGDAGFAFTAFVSILGTTMLSLYGGAKIEERYLAPMAENGSFCATVASERSAGSELTKITTTAARSGEDLVINGDKFFATNAGFASFLVVVTRAATNSDEHMAVVVPRDTPGVRMVKRWEMIGLRASGTYQVSFDRCRASARDVLDGSGLRILEVGLNASRILIASTAIGIARRIRDLCMEYARRKRVGDKPLLDNAVFAAKLGQMEMDIDAMRHVCRSAAREFDLIMGEGDAAEQFFRRGTLKSALTAKSFCGQTGWKIAGLGSEMFGGLGYTRDMIIDKLVRDIRHVSIIEGGDDVLRDLVFQRYVRSEDLRV